MISLADMKKTVLLETSGLVSIQGVDPRVHVIMDLKCPDSGECENNLWSNVDLLKPADEIKFVIASRRDFDWTIAVTREYRLDRRFTLLVSGVFAAVTPLQLAEWVLASGVQFRMQLQLHKYIWAPDARGV
jgi:7-carboxy-7-deazaguanine synthase